MTPRRRVRESCSGPVSGSIVEEFRGAFYLSWLNFSSVWGFRFPLFWYRFLIRIFLIWKLDRVCFVCVLGVCVRVVWTRIDGWLCAWLRVKTRKKIVWSGFGTWLIWCIDFYRFRSWCWGLWIPDCFQIRAIDGGWRYVICMLYFSLVEPDTNTVGPDGISSRFADGKVKFMEKLSPQLRVNIILWRLISETNWFSPFQYRW